MIHSGPARIATEALTPAGVTIPAGEIPLRTNTVVRGVHSLPVTWSWSPAFLELWAMTR